MLTDIYIYPVQGAFDVDAIESHLQVQPNTVRDAFDRDTFMIAWNAEGLEEVIEGRRRDATSFPYSVILIDVRSERIGVHHRVSGVEPARRFVLWLRARYQVRFQGEEFNDLSAHCRDNLDFLFGAPDPEDVVNGRSLTMDAHGNFTVSDDPQGAIAVALLVATSVQKGGPSNH